MTSNRINCKIIIRIFFESEKERNSSIFCTNYRENVWWSENPPYDVRFTYLAGLASASFLFAIKTASLCRKAFLSLTFVPTYDAKLKWHQAGHGIMRSRKRFIHARDVSQGFTQRVLSSLKWPEIPIYPIRCKIEKWKLNHI